VVRKGQGSNLTPFARDLMQQFKELNRKLQEDADIIFGNLL